MRKKIPPRRDVVTGSLRPETRYRKASSFKLPGSLSSQPECSTLKTGAQLGLLYLHHRDQLSDFRVISGLSGQWWG